MTAAAQMLVRREPAQQGLRDRLRRGDEITVKALAWRPGRTLRHATIVEEAKAPRAGSTTFVAAAASAGGRALPG